MKMSVCKRVTFDAAHYLPKYKGKCANMHGHHWTVELGVRGLIDKQTGMVVDFGWLKKALEDIVEPLDHACLNSMGLPFSANPTAENIALYVVEKFIGEWIQSPVERVQCEFVRVWESPDSFVELRV